MKITFKLHCLYAINLALALAIGAASQAHAEAKATDVNFEKIKAILEQPEEKIDLARAKLTIDHMIDPTTDQAAVLKQIDVMAAEINASFPVGASNLVKFKVLRDYLYQPSPASGRKKFLYNFEDDRNPKAKLLSVYLATHRGNCVSMPLLFVILGQKLEIPVTITTAPAHVYVKFRGDNGKWYGVETTSGGGWAEDDWQVKQFPTLTPKAIESGIYMQPLTKTEAVAVIADSLFENYESRHSEEADIARINLAMLLLDHYPKDINAMLNAYLSYRELRQHLFIERYPNPSDIPTNLLPQYNQLENGWLYWGNKAKELGFQAPTAEMDAAYRERIRRAKAGEEQ